VGVVVILWGAGIGMVWAEPVLPAIHVLLYHRFDEPQYGATSTSSGQLKGQLDLLKKGGYRFVSLPEFQAIVSGQSPWPSVPTVMVTVDDPYRSVAAVAAPLFRRAGIPWALAVNTEPLEGQWPDFMEWADVEGLAAQGIAILNHGHTHMGWDGEVTAMEVDLNKASALFQRHGIEPKGVAYPYGRYDSLNLSGLAAQRIRWGFSQDPGVVGPDVDRLLIPRIAIAGLNLKAFEEQLFLQPLPLVDRVPVPGGIVPDDRRVRGRVAHPERYEGDVNLFVSGLGAVSAQYDPNIGVWVSDPIPPLVRPVIRVKVSLKLRGINRFALTSWRVLDQEKGPPEGGP